MVVVSRPARSVLVGLLLVVQPSRPSLAAESAYGPKEDQRNLIAGICSTQLALDAAACSCLADRAINELNDAQLNYLILSVVQPPVAAGTDIGKSQAELGTIFTFLEAARRDCAAAEAPPVTADPAAPAEGATPPPADGGAGAGRGRRARPTIKMPLASAGYSPACSPTSSATRPGRGRPSLPCRRRFRSSPGPCRSVRSSAWPGAPSYRRSPSTDSTPSPHAAPTSIISRACRQRCRETAPSGSRGRRRPRRCRPT